VIPSRISLGVDLLDFRAAEKVLEIGCGRGVATNLIASRLAAGSVVGN
jgi:protein-L-isoaspartate O-methyltransferase